MEVILPGGLMVHAQSLAAEEYKAEAGLAPTRLQHMEERTAVVWGKVRLPENAALKIVQVCVFDGTLSTYYLSFSIYFF